MTSYAAHERAELCDLLDQLGPDAPTLDEPWDTAMLAAHLVLRDRRPDAALGIVVPPLTPYTARVQRRYAARPWPELVGLLRSGPPAWSPVRLPAADRVANLLEFFVHHEDVRRAQPRWAPRLLPLELDDLLWSRLGRSARLLLRRAPVGVVLQRPGGQSVHARPGQPVVTVIGTAQELLLYAFGRGRVAQVELTGGGDAVRQLAGVRLGL